MNQIKLLLIISIFSTKALAQVKDYARFTVKPSTTDQRITVADTPHLIQYHKKDDTKKLVLFIPGSNGIAMKSAPNFIATALQNGYKVITLSYINSPAISNTCFGFNLRADSDCAENFRNFRAFGIGKFPLVKDEAHDAIVNRLEKLITYLVKADKGTNWRQFLKNNTIDWTKITLAGQSQGGGMACFIAKKFVVDRVITFSGGWDYSDRLNIAKWYYKPSATPMNRWFGAYHVEEPAAKTIKQSYEAMQIPETQTFALAATTTRAKAHGQSVSNLIYKDVWVKMLTQ